MPVLTLASIKAALAKPKDYSLLSAPRISYQTFLKILTDNSSPAMPEAAKIWQSFLDRKVDPAVALAQFKRESTFGKLGLAVTNRSWGNIRWSDGRFIVYTSWWAGALAYGTLLSGPLYAGNKSYNTVLKMPYRWAPKSDGNDPAGYGQKMVADITAWIALDKKGTTTPVSTDRATTLANAIKTRVQYIQNRIASSDLDPRSYEQDITAINAYTDELHNLTSGAPQPDIATNTVSAPTTSVPATVPVTPEVTIVPPPPAPHPPATMEIGGFTYPGSPNMGHTLWEGVPIWDAANRDAADIANASFDPLHYQSPVDASNFRGAAATAQFSGVIGSALNDVTTNYCIFRLGAVVAVIFASTEKDTVAIAREYSLPEYGSTLGLNA